MPKRKAKKRKDSPIENDFLKVAIAHLPFSLEPTNLFYFKREHVFHDSIAYRMDFAWPHLKVAVETQGIRYHSRPAALIRDYTKYNLAQEHGWIVIQASGSMLKNDTALICHQIKVVIGKRVVAYQNKHPY